MDVDGGTVLRRRRSRGERRPPILLSGLWNDPFVEVVETISWVIQ